MAPLTGTASAPASVAAVLPVAKTMPACRGAMSRCETLTPASVRAESARPRSTATAASVALPSASGDAATRRHSAGPSVPAHCAARLTVFTRTFLVVNEVVGDHADAESDDALKNVRREREGREVGQIDALRLVKVRRQPTQKAVHAPALRELRDANRAHFLATYEFRPNRERRRRFVAVALDSAMNRLVSASSISSSSPRVLAMARKCEPKRRPQQRDRAKAIKRTRPSELAH